MRFKAFFFLALFSAAALANPPKGLFIVGGSGTGPQPNSVAKAILTAGSTNAGGVYTEGNALCDAVTPFYWEIGNAQGPIGGGTVYKSGQTPVQATTRIPIASASKMVYGGYIASIRSTTGGITSTDINYLHQTAGYTNLGNGDGTGASCPSSLSPRDVSTCLAQTNTVGSPSSCGFGLPYDHQNSTCSQNNVSSSDVGVFSYSGSQFEVHARDFGGFAGLSGTDAALNAAVIGTVAAGTQFVYSQPLLPGGLYGSNNDYAVYLRYILNGAPMLAYLGTNTVCATPGGNYANQTVGGVTGPSNCPATFTPIGAELWQYSLAHWVESDPAAHGDGAFSSPGAFGFYPWIDTTKTFYGVLSRKGGGGQGYASAQCGRLIRRAFITGIQQTGTIPTP